MKSYNQLGKSRNLGRAYIPLNRLVEGEEVTGWYNLDGGGEVNVTLCRTKRKVEDLQVQAKSRVVTMNNKMLFALNLVRQRLDNLGHESTINISLRMVLLECRLNVKVPAKTTDEEKKKNRTKYTRLRGYY